MTVKPVVSDAMVSTAVGAAEKSGGFAHDADRGEREALIRAALEAGLDVVLRRLAELEGAITWDTSCLNCARLLDSGYAETVRAEKAEAQAARLRALHSGSHFCVSDPSNAWSTWYSASGVCPTLAALDGVSSSPASSNVDAASPQVSQTGDESEQVSSSQIVCPHGHRCLRCRVEAKQRTASTRPDTPEEIAEQAATLDALMPWQLEAIAALDDPANADRGGPPDGRRIDIRAFAGMAIPPEEGRPKPTADTIAAGIHAALDDRRVTQAALARAIEMDPTALSKALAGRRRFSSLELALVAEHLQVSVDWILSPHTASAVVPTPWVDLPHAACASAAGQVDAGSEP